MSDVTGRTPVFLEPAGIACATCAQPVLVGSPAYAIEVDGELLYQHRECAERCTHHYVLERPKPGRGSRGRCKHCGDQQVFAAKSIDNTRRKRRAPTVRAY